MNVVFAHSDDLVVPLLVEWLEFVDVVRFDLACASSKHERENLGRLFSLPQTAFTNSKRLLPAFNRDVKQYFNWLLRRNVKFVNIVVTSDVASEAVLVEKYLTLCGTAVRSLDFIMYHNKIMSAAAKGCDNIKELTIHDGSDIEENCVLFSNSLETFYLNCESGCMDKNVTINFPNLKDLTLVGFCITDDTFVGILQHSRRLQRLNFEDVTTLTAVSFAAIGQYCQSLERLFVYNMFFSSAYLADILPFTSQLKELILSRAGSGVDEKEAFDVVAANCPALTELTIDYCASLPRSTALSSFATMLTNCVHLRTLTMEACEFVTDDYLLAIASKATQLVNLHLPECNVSNAGLAEVAKHCTQLECVSVSTGKDYAVTEECKLFFQEHTQVDVTKIDETFGSNFFGGDFAFDVGNGGFGFAAGNAFGAVEDDESNEDE